MKDYNISKKIWSVIRCRQKINDDTDLKLASQLNIKSVRTLKDYDKTDGGNITMKQIEKYCKLNKIDFISLLQSAELLTSAA